jgi:hypothetical protein
MTRSETREQFTLTNSHQTRTFPQLPSNQSPVPGAPRQIALRRQRRSGQWVSSLLPHGSEICHQPRCGTTLNSKRPRTRCRRVAARSPGIRRTGVAIHAAWVELSIIQPHSNGHFLVLQCVGCIVGAVMHGFCETSGHCFSLKAICAYQSFGFLVRATLTLSATVTRNVVITGWEGLHSSLVMSCLTSRFLAMPLGSITFCISEA